MKHFAKYIEVCDLYEKVLGKLEKHNLSVNQILAESNSERNFGTAFGLGGAALGAAMGGPIGAAAMGGFGSFGGSMLARYLKRKAHENHPPELETKSKQAAELIKYLIAATADVKAKADEGASKLPATTDPRERAKYESLAKFARDLYIVHYILEQFDKVFDNWAQNVAGEVDKGTEQWLHHDIMGGNRKDDGVKRWIRSWT
jgi:hypothetical protein